MMNSVRHLCCVKGCDWYYEHGTIVQSPDIYMNLDLVKSDPLKDSIREQNEQTEAVLTAHLLTHPWWKLPKVIRKYLKGKKKKWL